MDLRPWEQSWMYKVHWGKYKQNSPIHRPQRTIQWYDAYDKEYRLKNQTKKVLYGKKGENKNIAEWKKIFLLNTWKVGICDI